MKDTKKKRMGRPPKPRGERQGARRVFVNMTEAEFKTISATAGQAGCKSISEFFMRPWRKES